RTAKPLRLQECTHNSLSIFFFQAEDGIRYRNVTGVQTCALPISTAAGGLCLDPTARFQPVDTGQHHIQHDQVRLQAGGCRHPGLAVAHSVRAPALGLQPAGDLGGDLRFVLHHQDDSARGAHAAKPGTSSARTGGTRRRDSLSATHRAGYPGAHHVWPYLRLEVQTGAMITDWLLVALGVLLTAGTALFVAAEFSLVALDPAAVDKRAAGGKDRTAQLVQRALRQLATELSGAQVGITLTTVLLGYTMQAALANLSTRGLELTVLAQAATGALAVVISLVLVNTFSMLFGELVPKNWAISDPMRVARVVVRPQHAFTTALRPMITALNGSANKVLHLFGVEPREELGGGRSATELAAL